MTDKFNINEKFSKFSEHWRPKIVAVYSAKVEAKYDAPMGEWV